MTWRTARETFETWAILSLLGWGALYVAARACLAAARAVGVI